MIHWHVGADGLRIYRGGELVATIPIKAFGQLVLDLVRVMRDRS